MFKLVSISALIIFLFSPLLRAETNNIINLNLAYLEDTRLPTLSASDLKNILDYAKQELLIKFNAKNLNFNYLGKKGVSSFFDKYLKTDTLLYRENMKHKLKLFSGKIDYEPFKNDIIFFLSQWKLWDLKAFFEKGQQAMIKTYDDVLPFLFDKYFQKIKILRELTLPNGNFMIDRVNNRFNSYLNWIVAMHYQSEYDVVINNSLIVYDDITKPYPHAVLRFAKIGGSSFESPFRPIFDGTAAMVNLFERLTKSDYFIKNLKNKNLSADTWNRIMGYFIMAHEMGHMIYLIPDVYDHPRGCLMDSSMQNMDYYEGYQYLIKYPEPCVKCEPYVAARNNHFLGDRLFKEKKYNEAIDSYKIAAKMTPEKLDISYNSYISLIYYKIARAYLNLKDKEMVFYYLKKSIELDKDNIKTKNLLNLINYNDK